MSRLDLIFGKTKLADDGRISIPKSIRDDLGIVPGDELIIVRNGSDILIQQNKKRCYCCGSEEDLRKSHNFIMCTKCLKDFNTIKNITKDI